MNLQLNLVKISNYKPLKNTKYFQKDSEKFK